MLPNRTTKELKKVYGALCSFGCLPFKRPKTEDGVASAALQRLSPSDIKQVQTKVVTVATIFHAIFITLRFYQACKSKNQKFFLLFIHFGWTLGYVMFCWLHLTLFLSRFEVLAYCNGLFNFFGSFASMPGARVSAKCRRAVQRKPCLVDLLVVTFLVGAVLNTLINVEIFMLNRQSYQFVYSSIPPCWKEKFPAIIVFCVIYEIAMPGINWTLLLFYIIIHLVHLLCTRDYLIMLKRNTQKGILKLSELRHHYRSIQILHNHYNGTVATYMPLELFVVISLTFAGNIGTIRMIHSTGHNISIAEKMILPMMSILTIAFQMILYKLAGDLHHFSSYFIGSSKKGVFPDKSAKMCLRSFQPLCVKVGTLLDIRKFTVVKFVGGVVVGTSRLSILFFR